MTLNDEETAAIGVLTDRVAIRDTIHRYCRGLDRHDVATIDSVFFADSIDNHGDVLCYRLDQTGFDTVLSARPELVEALSRVLALRQAQNDATLQALGEEARSRHAQTRAAELVRKIREFFKLR